MVTTEARAPLSMGGDAAVAVLAVGMRRSLVRAAPPPSAPQQSAPSVHAADVPAAPAAPAAAASPAAADGGAAAAEHANGTHEAEATVLFADAPSIELPPMPPIVPLEPSPTSVTVRLTVLHVAPPPAPPPPPADGAKEAPPPPQIKLGYRVWLSLDAAGPYYVVNEGNAVPATVVDVELGALQSMCPYWVKAELLMLQPHKIDGNYSDPIVVHTTSPIPDPMNVPELTSRARNSLSVRFQAPKRKGLTVDGFVMLWDEGDLDARQMTVCYRGQKPMFKLMKLTANTPYRLQVAAFNAVGMGQWSPLVTYYTSPTVPSRPEPPQLVAQTDTTLTLSWPEPASNGAPVTSYKLELDDLKSGYFMSVYNGESRSCIVQQLVRNTEYKFRLTASNAEGDSLASAVVSYTTACARPGVPPAPRLPSPVKSDRAVISLDAPANTGGAPVEEFTVEITDAHKLPEEYRVAYQGPERTFVLAGLVPGWSYRVRVQCRNSVGVSDFSEGLSFRTLSGPPMPPRFGTAHCTDRSIDITWHAPQYDGGAPLLGYVIETRSEASPDSLDFEMAAQVGSMETSHTLGSLAPGRLYWVRVRAVNDCGASEPTPTQELLTRSAAPARPAAVRTTNATSGTIALKWSPADGNGLAVQEYVVEMSEGGKPFTPAARTPGLAADITHLQPATTYAFRLQAINPRGASVWSPEASFRTQSASPSAVTQISLSEATATAVTISWASPNDNGALIERYRVYVAEEQHPDERSALMQETTDTTLRVAGLRASTGYQVRVQPINAIGLGPLSRPVRFTTSVEVPAAPSGLHVVGVTYNSVKLKWKTPSPVTQTYEYVLQMAVEDGEQPLYWEPASAASFEGASARVQRLVPLTSYCFRVAASNTAGVSEFSSPVAARTPTAPLAPPVLRVVQGPLSETTLLVRGVLPSEIARSVSPSAGMGARKKLSSNTSAAVAAASIKGRTLSAGATPPRSSSPAPVDTADTVFELQETTTPEKPQTIYRGPLGAHDLGVLEPGRPPRTFRIRRVQGEVESPWSAEVRAGREVTMPTLRPGTPAVDADDARAVSGSAASPREAFLVAPGSPSAAASSKRAQKDVWYLLGSAVLLLLGAAAFHFLLTHPTL